MKECREKVRKRENRAVKEAMNQRVISYDPVSTIQPIYVTESMVTN